MKRDMTDAIIILSAWNEGWCIGGVIQGVSITSRQKTGHHPNSTSRTWKGSPYFWNLFFLISIPEIFWMPSAMTTISELASNLACALDPARFATSRLGFIPDEWQIQAMQSTSKCILLNCCRQSGKSTTTAIIALHTAIFKPGSLVLLVSPSLRQSRELFVKVTKFLKELSQKPKLDEDNKLSITLANRSRVVSLPSSPETIRGFSAVDLLIEDEAAFCEDDLYRSVRPMLAVSNGQLILMSTPYGKLGHFFEEWTNGGG